MNRDTRYHVAAQLEDRATYHTTRSGMGMWFRVFLSMAISLKRLADAHTHAAHNGVDLKITMPEGLHHEVTNMAWEAGRNFKHGSEIGR